MLKRVYILFFMKITTLTEKGTQTANDGEFGFTEIYVGQLNQELPGVQDKHKNRVLWKLSTM